MGLISGTSFDGIDVALIDVQMEQGEIRLQVIASESTPYSPDSERAIARSLPPQLTTFEDVCRLDTAIGQEFAAAADQMLRRHSADLVVSHGQTMFHWVEGETARGTLQLGQPAWIAELTGVPVVSDIRAADVASGGHGAPLASSFDTWLLRGLVGGPRASLNLGGISNITLVDTEVPISYDTGPANALIDAAAFMASDGARRSDLDGAGAARGQPDRKLLSILLQDPYYGLPAPKSTGKEYFNRAYLDRMLDGFGPIGVDDLLATLTMHAAEVVAREIAAVDVAEVVVAGGGVNNPTLMANLRHSLGSVAVSSLEDYGVPPDHKEAVFVAVHGWLGFLGVPSTLPSATGAAHPAVLGTVTNSGHYPAFRRETPPVMPGKIVINPIEIHRE